MHSIVTIERGGINLNAKAFVYKVMWLLGLLVLLVVGYHLENTVQRISSDTFNIFPQVWFSSLLPSFFGGYLSLLFIKRWSIHINASLLWCISLPCLILTIYVPVISSIASQTTSSFFKIPMWLHQINHFGILSFVGGFTLLIALFGFRRS